MTIIIGTKALGRFPNPMQQQSEKINFEQVVNKILTAPQDFINNDIIKKKIDLCIQNEFRNTLVHALVMFPINYDLLETNQLKLKQLLKYIIKDVDINKVNIYGTTPLTLAVEYNPYWIDILLNNGSDPEIEDDNGYSPLFRACAYNRLTPKLAEKSKNFINNKYSLYNKELQKDLKVTALQAACRYGDVETVNILLNNNADPNIKDNLGNNASHYAYFHKPHINKPIMNALIKHGAYIDRANNSNLDYEAYRKIYNKSKSENVNQNLLP